MKFMMMHYYERDEQEDEIPSPEFMAQMGAFMGEMAEKGVILAGEGVKLHKGSARLVFKDGKPVSIKDGPFAEAKELIGGFAIVDVKDKAEAIEIAKRFGAIMGDVQCDIRQVVTEEDLAGA
jgi:hypothetical protein